MDKSLNFRRSFAPYQSIASTGFINIKKLEIFGTLLSTRVPVICNNLNRRSGAGRVFHLVAVVVLVGTSKTWIRCNASEYSGVFFRCRYCTFFMPHHQWQRVALFSCFRACCVCVTGVVVLQRTHLITTNQPTNHTTRIQPTTSTPGSFFFISCPPPCVSRRHSNVFGLQASERHETARPSRAYSSALRFSTASLFCSVRCGVLLRRRWLGCLAARPSCPVLCGSSSAGFGWVVKLARNPSGGWVTL